MQGGRTLRCPVEKGSSARPPFGAGILLYVKILVRGCGDVVVGMGWNDERSGGNIRELGERSEAVYVGCGRCGCYGAEKQQRVTHNMALAGRIDGEVGREIMGKWRFKGGCVWEAG